MEQAESNDKKMISAMQEKEIEIEDLYSEKGERI
jgi:hypothetical protein